MRSALDEARAALAARKPSANGTHPPRPAAPEPDPGLDPANDTPEVRAAIEAERERVAIARGSEDADYLEPTPAKRPTPDRGQKPRWPDPKPVTALSPDGVAVDWLWHGCVARGHVTLFSALMKLGKTTLLGHLFRAFQYGVAFAGRETRACKTLIVSEESETIWARRRDALDLDDHLHTLCRPMLAKPNFGEWGEFVDYVAGCAAARACDLVVFDTIGAFAPWRNENDAAEVQGTMNTLNRLTQADLGVLLFHHHGKTDSGEGRAARGSTAMAGAVDVLLELRRFKPDDADDRRRVLSGLGRFDEVPTELVVTLEADGSGYTATGDRKAEAARELQALILDALPTEEPGATADEVHEEMAVGTRPRRGDVMKGLQDGAAGGLWRATGTGKKGSPRRFWRVVS